MTTSMGAVAAVLASLLVSATALAAPRAAVVVRATGFAEQDASRLVQKAHAEVASRGFEIVVVDDADPACLAARACARDLVKNAGAAALVRVDLLRGGGNVQIAGAVVDGEGRPSDDVTGIARLASVLGADPLLPVALLDALAAARPVEPPPSTTGAPSGAATGATAAVTSSTPQTPAPPAAPAPGDQPLSTTAVAAIGGVTIGALAAVIGVVGASGQYAVARDPAAAGADKERAAVLVPTLVGVGVVGAAIAGVSGWLLLGELDGASTDPAGASAR